jgi:hypothetical protein
LFLEEAFYSSGTKAIFVRKVPRSLLMRSYKTFLLISPLFLLSALGCSHVRSTNNVVSTAPATVPAPAQTQPPAPVPVKTPVPAPVKTQLPEPAQAPATVPAPAQTQPPAPVPVKTPVPALTPIPVPAPAPVPAPTQQPTSVPTQAPAAASTQEQHEEKKSETRWAPSVEALAAVANLILVAYLFHLSTKQQRSERRTQIAGFWIQELILRKHNEMIHKFFDDYEDKLKKPTIHPAGTPQEIIRDKAQTEVVQFSDRLRHLTHEVIEPLQWVHEDFNQLSDIRNAIQDLITAELYKIPGVAAGASSQAPAIEPADKLGELRRSFFQSIHQIQVRGNFDV